jgi:hypothetical protein
MLMTQLSGGLEAGDDRLITFGYWTSIVAFDFGPP